MIPHSEPQVKILILHKKSLTRSNNEVVKRYGKTILLAI